MPRAILFALLLIVAPGSFDAGEPRPDFSGVWQLNEELSEDPREKMRQQRSRGGGGFGRGGGGGFGRSGGGGGFGRGGQGRSRAQGQAGQGQAGQERGQRGDWQSGAAQLEIIHQGPCFLVVDDADRERRFDIDGEPKSLETPNGGSLELSAEWKRGDRLELTVERSERPKMTETYELIADGAKLYVDIEIESSGRRPEIKFRRVYDRVEADPLAETDARSEDAQSETGSAADIDPASGSAAETPEGPFS